MKQKICVISFDHWNYDKHIVDTLNDMNIEAFHIKIGNFKHKNYFARIQNTFSKIFLGVNPKLKKRQEYIIETLNKKGHQDQILVINPELINLEYHLKIKKYTKKYICYLYDSMSRCPVKNLLNEIFDEIYSFDKDDIKKYGFKEINNYNYISKQPLVNHTDVKNQVLYIASFDKRLEKALKIKELLKKDNISFRFIVVGKQTILFKLKNLFSKNIQDIELQSKRINQEELKQLYRETAFVLDLVRENQSGLSFRIFEAMAFERKVITNNLNVKNYNFYNPNNILVIQNDSFEFNKDFFKTNYIPLPDDIYYKYTLNNWVNVIFNLKNK